MPLRHALTIANFGEYAEPRTVIRVAQTAEGAGWDGLFLWDHLAYVWGIPSADPFVLLGAIAASTERLVLGTAVTPIARRRVQVLANQVATLAGLAPGRVVLGVGLGGEEREFAAFGEEDDATARAVRLDEGMAVLSALLRGEEVTHHGLYYAVDGVRLAPVPDPPVPIWVGATKPRALRRAARWDGWIPDSVADTAAAGVTYSPERLAADISYIREHREGEEQFDVAFMGYTEPGDQALVRSYADAGATWWLEPIHGRRGSLDQMLARIAAGPARG